MSKFRTLTSGLSLGDALRLSEKQAAGEQARQQEREAQQAEERRVLQAAREQVEAQRRMQEEVIRTRDAIAKRAQDAGGFEGIVLQPMYAGATGVVDGLGPPGDLATWAGEQALAHTGALVRGGDPEENYRNIAAYREMVQKKHPYMTEAGSLVGSYAKQQVPPWIGLAADTAAGATMEGINKGFTIGNLYNGAKEGLVGSLAGQGIAKMGEVPLRTSGVDFNTRSGKFAKDLIGVAADKVVEGYNQAAEKGPPAQGLSEETWRPATRYLSADPEMDSELIRRIEAQVFAGGKPRGLADFARPSGRSGP